MDTFRLNLASLQSRGPLLRQGALRPGDVPGDVLLVKGNQTYLLVRNLRISRETLISAP